ncbi:MAG: sulfate ABC transporter permease subunit CysT [Verrucomicrobia bacterium]|nr:sulfate ABC transporter permease subunit CysT [Verrucomicrobiota bacterium]
MSRPRVIPGFGLSLGTTVVFLALATLLPLGALVLKSAGLTWAEFWGYISDSRALAAYRVTLLAAGAATFLNLVLGVLTAWILVRYEFPGRRLLDAAIDLPFALPTAVAGIALATLTVPAGPVGALFAGFGIKIAYAFPGIVLAMTFTSLPFVVRTVQPVLADLEPALEEAAASLGAGPFTTFRRVILPELRPAIIAGGTLALVRSLGEFGAVVFIAGNLPFQTEIAALLIYIRMDEFDYVGAAALATAILAFALTLLVAMNLWQGRLYRRLHG